MLTTIKSKYCTSYNFEGLIAAQNKKYYYIKVPFNGSKSFELVSI
jgi:hypothetical protein